jgi:hypothetical protein
MSSEQQPHIVFAGTGRIAPKEAACLLFSNFKDAHAFWGRVHDSIRSPHLIATVRIERVIDPSEAVVDVGE